MNGLRDARRPFFFSVAMKLDEVREIPCRVYRLYDGSRTATIGLAGEAIQEWPRVIHSMW
jgi:hypothetical protein